MPFPKNISINRYVVSCLFYPSVEFYATVATTQIGGLQAKGKTSQTFKTFPSKYNRQLVTRLTLCGGLGGLLLITENLLNKSYQFFKYARAYLN